MSFNDQVHNLTTGGGRRSVFRDGVKSKALAGDNAILFRIQPAFNYEDRDGAGNINPCGWVPCRLSDGALTSWGGVIKICRYMGHGHGKASNRRDFLSPWTFGKPDSTFCPLNTLYVTASNYPEWQYLLEDRKDAGGRLIERAALSQPNEQLVINIVELSGGAMPENILGLLSKSACDSLVNPNKNGLLFQRANNVTDDDIARNPLCAWAIGDITHPTQGPVMFVTKLNDGKGKMSSYMCGLATDPQQHVRRFPLDAALMMQRYDLSDMHNVIEPKTDEELIRDLVTTFCMRSPQGYHEYVLLKLAFGDFYKIPDPPAAPAASPTVAAGGFGPQAGGVVGANGGFGPNPAAAASIPTYGAPAAPAAASAAPVASPVAGPRPMSGGQQPAMTQNVAQGPAQPPVQVPGIGNVAAAANAAQAPVAAPAAQAGAPVVPGDPVRPFDRQGFLGELRAGPGGQVAKPQ